MRILCVIDSLCLGGAQRQLVELARGFIEEGHNVSFLTYHDIPFYGPELEALEIPVTCIHGRNYIHRLIHMRKFIRRGNYDGVLSFLEAANFICEVAGFPRRKWRLVVGERSSNPKILTSPKLVFYRVFHLWADYVVANSSENIRLVRKANLFLSNQKCKVIFNSVDFSTWKKPDSFVFRRKGKVHMVIAARIDEYKNLSGLLEALLMLTDHERNQLSMQWYGITTDKDGGNSSGNMVIGMVKKAGLEGILSFHPAQRDISEFFFDADVVGLFSLHEGQPNAVCEGMACGKPIICSAISDLPALLSHEPELLFNPNNPASICKALKYLIAMTPAQLENSGLRNLEIAHVNFDMVTNVSHYIELLKGGVMK